MSKMKSKTTNIRSSLCQAVQQRDFKLVNKLILLNDTTTSTRWINEFDNFGWTGLHYAAFYGDQKIAEKLIENGADVNIRSPRAGETPLLLASAVDNVDIVKFLLKEQADPNSADITGRIPLDVSPEGSKTKEYLSNVQLQSGKIMRFLPTIRKLLASKFMQLLLQLIICVLLELFHDNLLVNIFSKFFLSSILHFFEIGLES